MKYEIGLGILLIMTGCDGSPNANSNLAATSQVTETAPVSAVTPEPSPASLPSMPIPDPIPSAHPEPSPSPSSQASPLPLGPYQFPGGNGFPENPYLITNVQDLAHVKEHLHASFQQTNHIDLDGIDFATIGPIGSVLNPFDGNYDGGGFEIRNLSWLHPENHAQFGMFLANTGSSTISHLSLVGVNIVNYGLAAGIVSYMSGHVLFCSVYGKITFSAGYGPGVPANPIYTERLGPIAQSSQNYGSVLWNGVWVNGPFN